MHLLLTILAALFAFAPFVLVGMAIATGVPAGIKRPGSYHTFVFSTQGAGLTPIGQVVALVGAKTTAGTATADVPYEVFDVVDGDARFGVGSGLALMIRAFFKQVAKNGGLGPRLFAVGLTEPGAGTAHVKTATFAGTATESKTSVVRIAGVPVSFAVTSGDSAATAAAALEAQLDAKASELPVTASVAAAVVTCTHRTKGEVGADVLYETIELAAGLTIAYATTAAGAGVTDATAALTALRAFKVHAVGNENRKAADVTIGKTDAALAWGYAAKEWRHYVYGDPSTLATADTLASNANDYTQIVVQCEASPTLGGQLAAAFCARVWSTDRPNANFDNIEIVGVPPADASVYTSAELETALAAGTVPLVPTAAKDALKIVRAVTTKTTTNSAQDYSAYDLAVSRTAAAVAEQIDARFQRDFTGLEAVMVIDDDDPDDVRAKVKGMVVSVHKAYEALRPPVLRDVDDFIPQIRVEQNPSDPGRLDVDDPFRVVSPLHQGAFRHRAYL